MGLRVLVHFKSFVTSRTGQSGVICLVNQSGELSEVAEWPNAEVIHPALIDARYVPDPGLDARDRGWECSGGGTKTCKHIIRCSVTSAEIELSAKCAENVDGGEADSVKTELTVG